MEDFPTVSLTKAIRQRFVKGFLTNVTCADANCRRNELKKEIPRMHNKPPLLLMTLNRVLANQTHTEIQRNTNPVDLGGLLRIPIGQTEAKYRLIGTAHHTGM